MPERILTLSGEATALMLFHKLEHNQLIEQWQWITGMLLKPRTPAPLSNCNISVSA